MIQTLLLRVRGEAMSAEELEAYCARLNEITAAGGRIKEVHLYTMARPAPHPCAGRLAVGELEVMAARVRRQTRLKVLSFD